MTSFGWKRKRLRDLGSASATAFTEDDGEETLQEDVDWLAACKKARRGELMLLEDSGARSKRLQQEGAILAESERYWEAVKYWNEALELTPDCAALYEMKAQVLMELSECFLAVQCAEKATQLEPTWVLGWQTLGRAQLGIGDVHMALRSFEKALHLDPSHEEVRNEDLTWAQKLVKQKESILGKTEK